MSIMFITDPHISEEVSLAGGNEKVHPPDDSPIESGLVRRSIRDAERTFEWMLKTARAKRVDAIIVGGDLYDRANPTPNEEAFALRWMRNFASIAPTYVILGNHTQSDHDAESALASLRAADFNFLEVVEAPDVFDLGPVDLYCLPYPPIGRIVSHGRQGWTDEMQKGEVRQGLARIVEGFAEHTIQRDKPGVLASHVTFAGASYATGRTVPMTDVQCPTARLPDFSAVLGGHIHKRQRIGGLDNAWYIGPPDRWSFSDAGNPVGCASLEFNDGEPVWTWHENPYAREFLTAEPDDDDTVPHAFDNDSFVRVRGTVESMDRLREVESWAEAVREHAAAVRMEVNVQHDDSRFEEDPDEMTSVRDVYEAWLEDRPDAIPEDKREQTFEVVHEVVNNPKQ